MKKTAKKSGAKTKKRKASAAQLAALKRGRAKAAANRKKATPKKKAVTKKAVTKKKKVAVNKRFSIPKENSMATTTKTPEKKKRRRSSRRSGFGGKMKGIMPMVKDVGLAVAGGVGANVLANRIPIANPKVKAAVPLVAGILLSTVIGKNKPIFREIGTGMAVLGGLALLKQFAPNVPMLAGEEDIVLLPSDYQYQGEMQQLGYEGGSPLMGEMQNMGEEEYISPADL